MGPWAPRFEPYRARARGQPGSRAAPSTTAAMWRLCGARVDPGPELRRHPKSPAIVRFLLARPPVIHGSQPPRPDLRSVLKRPASFALAVVIRRSRLRRAAALLFAAALGGCSLIVGAQDRVLGDAGSGVDEASSLPQPDGPTGTDGLPAGGDDGAPSRPGSEAGQGPGEAGAGHDGLDSGAALPDAGSSSEPDSGSSFAADSGDGMDASAAVDSSAGVDSSASGCMGLQPCLSAEAQCQNECAGTLSMCDAGCHGGPKGDACRSECQTASQTCETACTAGCASCASQRSCDPSGCP